MMLRIFRRNYPIRNVFFVIGEACIIFISVMLANWISEGISLSDKRIILKALLISFTIQIAVYYCDLYQFNVKEHFVILFLRLLLAVGVATVFLAGVYTLYPPLKIDINVYFISVCFVILFMESWRLGYIVILKKGILNQKIIVLGWSELAQNIVKEITRKDDCGYSVACVAVESPDDLACVPESNSSIAIYRKKFEGLCNIVDDLKIKVIVVALKEKRGGFPTQELLNCRISGIDIFEGVHFYEMLTGKFIVGLMNPASIIFSYGFKQSVITRFFKRNLDIACSFFLLLTASPIILILILLIKIDSEGDVVYSQERIGEKGKVFRIYKFRSMIQDSEKFKGTEWTEENDPRITRIGRFMRKSHLDELPQLWNILKGDMSFVGPRPEQPKYVKVLNHVIPYYRERHSAKPGLTGWAQINYGYGASVEDATEKLNYDLFYIKNMSLFMDIVIIFRTVKTVLQGKDAR